MENISKTANEKKSIIKIDLLLKITTPITCKEGRKVIGTGTGFFFRFNNITYLVSNRHIFINEKRNFFPDKLVIRLNLAGQDTTQSGEIRFDLYESNSDKQKWVELSKDIDLAAIKIDDPVGFIYAALTEANIAPSNYQLGLGEQVLVIGYPRGFYDEIHNLPITRNATVASAYGIPFKKQPFFLIDSKLHPGTSGSPVITVPKHIINNPGGGFRITPEMNWRFLGVNSGEFGDLQLNAVWYSELILRMLKK